MTRKLRILIVDDEPQFLNALCRRLELRGFEVARASNGQEAVVAARTGNFDLALLDLKMPGMDGKEVLQVLKTEQKHLEIIVLTGHGALDTAIECTRLGAFGYIPKPYELERLLTVLKDAFECGLMKKFKDDKVTLDKIKIISIESDPLDALRRLCSLDEEVR